MSSCRGSKCGEEEALDLFYLEIEQRILLLISEEEEEEDDCEKRKKELQFDKKICLVDASWCNESFVKRPQPQATEQRRGGCHGRENVKPWIDYGNGERNINGGRRMSPEFSGRRGTGVFIPKSLVHMSC